jgi:hypothetical protein
VPVYRHLPCRPHRLQGVGFTSQTTDGAIGRPAAVGTAAIAPSMELDGRDGAAASSPKQARDGRRSRGAGRLQFLAAVRSAAAETTASRRKEQSAGDASSSLRERRVGWEVARSRSDGVDSRR